MPIARNFLLLAALSLAYACGSAKPVGVTNPAAADPDKLFDDGRPDLPPGPVCLAWPMNGHRKITSRFRDPNHPFVPGAHDGTDIAARAGTPVVASMDGVVHWTRAVADDQDATIVVAFGDEWTFELHHLSRIDVIKGQSVVRGQVLGLSGGAVKAPGSGPWTTGPHLHFSLSHRKAYVNAAQYFCP